MVVEALLIGLLLALLFTECTGVTPGGLIVPGYLAVYVDQPLRIAATLAAALVGLALYRLLARYLILYGRRRFVLLVLAGAAGAQGWVLLAPRLLAEPAGMLAIGYVVPGILAGNLARQKAGPAMAALAIVTAATYFVVKVAAWL